MFNQFIDLFLALCFFAAGVYCVYTFIVSRKWDKLKRNEIMYPAECAPSLCLDPQSFLRYIRPRMLIFGLLCIGTAAVVVLSLLPITVPPYTNILGFSLGVLVCCFYILSLRAAKKRFW